jgi:hypothetical protein
LEKKESDSKGGESGVKYDLAGAPIADCARRCMADDRGLPRGRGCPLFPDAEKHNSASSSFFRRALPCLCPLIQPRISFDRARFLSHHNLPLIQSVLTLSRPRAGKRNRSEKSQAPASPDKHHRQAAPRLGLSASHPWRAAVSVGAGLHGSRPLIGFSLGGGEFAWRNSRARGRRTRRGSCYLRLFTPFPLSLAFLNRWRS